MNGRKLYREYIKSLGKDCHEFVKIEEDWYDIGILHYKTSEGVSETVNISRKLMVEWIIKSFSNKMWEGYKV